MSRTWSLSHVLASPQPISRADWHLTDLDGFCGWSDIAGWSGIAFVELQRHGQCWDNVSRGLVISKLVSAKCAASMDQFP